MLREAGEHGALVPQPSLRRLTDLAAQVSAAGLPVEVTVEGSPVELPPGVDVSAYRIVQEALTNALKHAGPAHAHVYVRYLPSDLELEVVDDGAGDRKRRGFRARSRRHPRTSGVYGGKLESGRPRSGRLRAPGQATAANRRHDHASFWQTTRAWCAPASE